MSRRHLTFDCQEAELYGTLDEAPGKVGLLIVTGGNETRAGAFGGQAKLAAKIAAAGYPVFRFDRRGVADSEGENGGYRESRPDIAAAIAAFCRFAPQVQKIIGHGNCDAASALMLGGSEGCDGLVLANPWTFDDDADDTIPSAAIRSRYASKLRNPRELWRLLTGGVSMSKLANGLKNALSPAALPSSLSEDIDREFQASAIPARFLIAGNDRTGKAFMAACPQYRDRCDVCPDAGHSFAEPDAREWLLQQLLAVLDEQARQLDMG